MGRKGAMLLGLSLFGSGTILCGLAPSMETLIIARAIAGMGGGGVMTVSSVAVTDLIPLKQRGLYQGMANILYGLGAGIGGPVGGWLNDAFGWRSAFLFQAPILLFSFVLVALKVNIELPQEIQDEPVRQKLRRIDFLGSLTLVGAVGSLLLGLSLKSTEELPWSDPLIWGLLLGSLVWGTIFVSPPSTPFVPQGFGMASLITTTLIAMIASVYKEDMAVATGITYLFRTTGQVLGVSLSGALLQAVLLGKLRQRIQGPGALDIIEQIRHSTAIIPELDAELKQAAIDSYADALRAVFTCQAAICFLGLLTCVPIQENPLPGSQQEQEEYYRNRSNHEWSGSETDE
ncbi:hypothetical protein ONZ45_g6 [Pleurotus djamor]|nr:hypothetical protein ONZ45_g17340 [Pleurotus djamor]KAJ8523450.1 hypothetical protein ONZ45_g6 [Pleurotus djamor]